MAEYDYAQDSIVLAEEPDSDTEVTYEREIAAHNLENPAEAKAGSGIVVKSEAALASAGIFAKIESTEGVKWMATKPWKGAIVAPSAAPKNDPTAPEANLAIDWIHGYRGFDARSNLVYNSAGHMVYPIAGVVVVYDAKEHKQRHFMGHNDDVTCLAQSPVNANIIATGQVATIVNRRATPPHICVWDSSDVGNAAKVIKLPNAGQRAIRSLSFSSDGRLLASVANDEKQTVTVWDWATKTRLATHEGDGNKVYQVKWNHKVPGEFVTVGEKSIYFWTWDGSNIKRTKAKMGGKYPWQSFGSVTFSEKGYACCGAFDGSIYVFIGGEAKKVVKVHSNKINSLDWFAGGIVCGSSDCKAVVLDKTLTAIRTLQFPSKVSSVYIAGDNLLVGTMGAEIFEVPAFRTADESKLEPTIRGHCEGELWGLAVAPDAKHYVTCGEDNRVFKWQLGTHKCVGSAIIADKRGAMPKILRASTMSTLPPNQCARAVAISPNGADFAIGCNDGLVHVYDFASMTKKATIDLNPHGKRMVTNQKGNWIQVAKYSPSGDLLAVGTHGSVICLLDPKRGYAVRGVLDKHNSFLTHIDWSLDGQFMQSNDGAYELLFWSIDEKEPSASRQHTNVTALRDTQWASQTCILGWSVQGIFDPTQDGTDVNTVDTAPSKRFIVTGDDYGDLNLFRYPCAAEGNAKKSFIGHSSHVVTTRFTPDERHVISTGGNDKALFVWRVTA